MELELTMMERFLIVSWINVFNGTVEVLDSLIQDAEKLVVKNSELEAVGGEVDEAGNWKWNESTEKPVKMTLTKGTIDFCKSTIEQMNEQKAFTVKDRAVVTLSKKLN